MYKSLECYIELDEFGFVHQGKRIFSMYSLKFSFPFLVMVPKVYAFSFYVLCKEEEGIITCFASGSHVKLRPYFGLFVLDNIFLLCITLFQISQFLQRKVSYSYRQRCRRRILARLVMAPRLLALTYQFPMKFNNVCTYVNETRHNLTKYCKK